MINCCNEKNSQGQEKKLLQVLHIPHFLRIKKSLKITDE